MLSNKLTGKKFDSSLGQQQKSQFAQAYVASGCPYWLKEVFEDDKS